MAYNFMCETPLEPQWDELNKLFKKYDRLEAFPMPETDDNHFALAVSVPLKNVGFSAHRQFVSAFKQLTRKHKFTIYDMYYGKIVDKPHLKILLKELC